MKPESNPARGSISQTCARGAVNKNIHTPSSSTKAEADLLKGSVGVEVK